MLSYYPLVGASQSYEMWTKSAKGCRGTERIANPWLAKMAEKHPQEISNLMAYAQIVQRISDACGDAAALTYDDKFRRWREKDPGSCPCQLKNVELY